jgi:hypothetical protein
MKAIVITNNNYRGQFVVWLLSMNRHYIKYAVKKLIAEGKAEVFEIGKDDNEDWEKNKKHYAKAWLDLGEIVFGKTEKVKVKLI